MFQVVVATGNRGKIKEIAEILEPFHIPVYAMGELNLHPDIVEDGNTFLENAQKKVDALALLGLENTIFMGDDSGLDIDALNHAPGIYSARFMGEETPYPVRMQAILNQMDGLWGAERSCRFHCAIVLRFPDGTYAKTEKTMEGEVGEKMSGDNGFGYDPFFYVPSKRKMVADLTDEEKNEISHRGQAVRWAGKVIQEWISVHLDA